MENTPNTEALAVLETEEALHKKLTMKQFLWLTVVTIVIPVIALIGIGAAL